MRPSQNGRHFADDSVQCTFLNGNVWIAIKISLNFIPKGPINNIPVLVQLTVCRRRGHKPLFEPMSKLRLVCRRIYASRGLTELIETTRKS